MRQSFSMYMGIILLNLVYVDYLIHLLARYNGGLQQVFLYLYMAFGIVTFFFTVFPLKQILSTICLSFYPIILHFLGLGAIFHFYYNAPFLSDLSWQWMIATLSIKAVVITLAVAVLNFMSTRVKEEKKTRLSAHLARQEQ